MKEVTIKTMGWTTFGVVFCIMFYGMFIALSVSNADVKTEHIITVNMDNETKEALIKLSEIQNYDHNLSIELEKQKARNENLRWAYEYVVEETRKTNDWVDNISQTYFDMRNKEREAYFQLALCRHNVSNWEEYVEKKYGEGYLEINP